VSFHVGSKQSVDPGLIALPLSFEPFHHITIYPQGKLLFAPDFLQPSPHHCSCKHLWWYLASFRKIYLLILQRVDALPISL